MSRRLALLLCGLSISLAVVSGCASLGIPFGKTAGISREQWEPEVEGEEDLAKQDWRKAPASVRKGKFFEDPMDKFLMSEEARDIERSVGGRF